ncbi:MAG: ThuA domain-containing protein [Acidobacteriota bacterium]|nr:MAG: ThuA domain-containing protein [Acidobacteriota bacterium]
MLRLRSLILICVVLSFLPFSCAQDGPKKRLLAIGMSAGWQHDSVSDALATMYQLGKETGLWETYIRTDVELITKQKLEMNAKNLDDFDAVFFMTTGELPLSDQQKADLIAFVRDEGKGFLGAHNATDTFYKWPEYGEMIGGYFDGHPWNIFDAKVIVEDQQFPAVKHFKSSFVIKDEIYQTRNFSRERVRVLMSLDTGAVDMKKEGVKAKEIPVTWVREYGKGRVFYSGLGHLPAVWDNSDVRKMWIEAVKWTMGMIEGDAAPK